MCFQRCKFLARQSLMIFGASALMLLQGCTSPLDYEAYSNMSSAFIAIKLYDESVGHLPAANGNTWKYSNSSRFETVSWRVLVMDRIANYESHLETDKPHLEDSIIACAEANFRVETKVIYSNFSKLGSVALSSLPKHTILAMTVMPPGDYQCTDTEPYDLFEVNQGNNAFKFSDDCTYILFANGTVGKVIGIVPRQIALLLDPSTAGRVNADDLDEMGIQILQEGSTIKK